MITIKFGKIIDLIKVNKNGVNMKQAEVVAEIFFQEVAKKNPRAYREMLFKYLKEEEKRLNDEYDKTQKRIKALKAFQVQIPKSAQLAEIHKKNIQNRSRSKSFFSKFTKDFCSLFNSPSEPEESSKYFGF